MRRLALVVLAALVLPAALANADTIVAPNANAAVEGNEGNSFPFSQFTDGRYQQAYAADQFPGGLLSISQIAFRLDVDPSTPSSFVRQVNLEISLSTSPNPVGSLSITFADNVGGDEVLVFAPGGSVLISGTQNGAPGPNPFDVIFTFDTPFVYDASQGDLLMDVTVFSATQIAPPTETSFLDSVESTTGLFDVSVQRVWNSTDGGAAAGQTDLHGAGLVTQFTFDVVPEPGTGLLVALGLLGLAGRRCNR